MKRILTILFLLISSIGFCQTYPIKQNIASTSTQLQTLGANAISPTLTGVPPYATPLLQLGDLSNTPNTSHRYGIAYSSAVSNLAAGQVLYSIYVANINGAASSGALVGVHSEVATTANLGAVEGVAGIGKITNSSSSVTVSNLRGVYASSVTSGAGTKTITDAYGAWIPFIMTGGTATVGTAWGVRVDLNTSNNGVGNLSALNATTFYGVGVTAPSNGTIGTLAAFYNEDMTTSQYAYWSKGGKVRLQNMGTAASDTTTYKPLGIDANGNVISFTFWPGSGGSGGTVDVEDGYPLLKSGDNLLTSTRYLGLPFSQYNQRSGYTLDKAWVLRTSDGGSDFVDGQLSFFFNDTLWAAGGFDNSNITNQIRYSVDQGRTWATYATTLPYAIANVATIKARNTNDYNYIFGHTTDNSRKRTVLRFKNWQNIEVMTTTAEYGERVIYGVAIDDNGGLYVIGGQNDRQDTLTTLNDMWYSSPQSGGASWTRIQNGVSKIGGCLINQCNFYNGYLWVVNSGNKMNSAGVSAYSRKTMRIPYGSIADATQWEYVQDMDSSHTGLFAATRVHKGLLWVLTGNNVGAGNMNTVSYYDADGVWHRYYNFPGIDSTAGSTISSSHAADLLEVGQTLKYMFGNSNKAVWDLVDTTFSTPPVFRQSLQVSTTTYLSQIRNSARTLLGNGVTASQITDDQFIRVSTNTNNMWMTLSDGGGWRVGNLTSGNSTLNVPVSQGTGLMLELTTAGVLTTGTSASTGTTLYVNTNGHFDGNDAAAPLTWNYNGADAHGVLTGVSGQAWAGGTTGVNFALLANNARVAVLTSTGMYVGGSSNPTNTLHVGGSLRLENGTEGDGKLLISSSTGVGTWTNTFTGTTYTFGASGSGSSPTVTVLRGMEVYGNAVAPSLGWGETTGGGVLGKLTYDAGHPWIVANTGANLKLGANNALSVIISSTGVAIGTTSTAVASAKLELVSTTQGFLPPRMTGTQAEAISSPAEGLMIYSTDGSGSTITSKGWWGWTGAAWVKLN